jgi:hypothetical protein
MLIVSSASGEELFRDARDLTESGAFCFKTGASRLSVRTLKYVIFICGLNSVRNNFRGSLGTAGGNMEQTEYEWQELYAYGWEEVYASAVLETDWTKIEQKIQAADNVIRARLHELSLHHGGTPEENKAIADALHGLDTLRNEVATWQKSNRAS